MIFFLLLPVYAIIFVVVCSYTKVVVKGMTKAEMVLKVVMSSNESVRTFIEQFRKLLADSDLQDLQRVLEMKVSLKKKFFFKFFFLHL